MAEVSEEMRSVTRNVLFALRNHPTTSRQKRSAVADLIKVSQSTISRWETGKTSVSELKVRVVAELLHIDRMLFYRSEREFADIISSHSWYMSEKHQSVTPRVELFSTEKWRGAWDASYDRHRGSYLLRLRIPSAKQRSAIVVVALVHIHNLSERGMEFKIYNPDTRLAGLIAEGVEYTYSGFVFPINDVLFFVGDELSGDEPLSIVTTSSQLSPPSVLTGYIVAVGVTPEERYPMARKMSLTFVSRDIVDPKSMELGQFQEGDVDARHLEYI